MPDLTSDVQKMKRCSKGEACCHDDGPMLPATVEYFYRSKREGLGGYCRECAKKTAREWAKNNPEKTRERYRKWVKNNPEKKKKNGRSSYARNRERRLAEKREYYKRKSDQIKANARAWSEANPEKRKAISQNWLVNNPEKRKKASQRYGVSMKGKAAGERRRAREREAFGNHSGNDLQRINKKQNGKCLYCGISLNDDYHIDHFVPLSATGANSPDNISLACKFCNLSKGKKLPWDWEHWNGAFPVEWEGRLL